MESNERFYNSITKWRIHPQTRLLKHIFGDLGEKRLNDWRLMKIEDIDFSQNIFIINPRGKHDKLREVCFNNDTMDILQDWLKYHSRVSPYLFPYHLGAYQEGQFSKIFRGIFGLRIMEWRVAQAERNKYDRVEETLNP